jgi:hypothetical protein
MCEQQPNTTANQTACGSELHNSMEGKETQQFEEACEALQHFIGATQKMVLAEVIDGEESQFFVGKLNELANIMSTMPKTYETDGQGDEAIAHLHYFTAGFDWYITERDMEEEQLQAFGLACLFEKELGYISIDELLRNGAELDLHFEPRAIKYFR